ncbi:MAG: dihydropyrimidinase [Candidatus Aminicenantes bacterium]|nr:dihydropyrimidinase [Candidatus Aminicenantes bacterium]
MLKEIPILIENGAIVTDESSFKGDILIDEGKIKDIGSNLQIPDSGVEIIDATDLYVFPGGIDAHVHMEKTAAPGIYSADNFESGTYAAVCGGTTSIIDFVTPNREQSLLEALKERKEIARKSLCDYGFHIAVTSWDENKAAEMKKCVEQEGIASFKIYLAYKDTIGLDDAAIIHVMDTAAALKTPVIAHCENSDLIHYLQQKFLAKGKKSPKYHPLSRPPEAEKEAVVRALVLAKITDCPLYIAHVSTRDAVTEIAAAREQGQRVFAETCPHYLLLDEKKYNMTGFASAAYVVNPPLRAGEHAAALWRALKDEVIQVASSDHRSFNMKDREKIAHHDFSKIPNGVPGVENRLSLLYTYGVLQNRISINQFVEMTAAAPARIFGLYPRKGTLKIGSDADIVVWDPTHKGIISTKTHGYNCDNNIYEGFPIKGKPHVVICSGKIAYEDDIIRIEKGSGNYLSRETSFT